MADIVPAILTKTLGELERELIRVRGAVKSVQIDIVDGTFAPNATWPYADDFQFSIFNFQNIAKDMEIEIDLMADEPEDMAEQCRRAGAARIIIHADAPDAREALLALRFESEEHKKPEGLVAGIALPSTASVDMLREYEHLYSFVQVMGIEKVGFQGQPFDPRAVDLVRGLRAQFPNLPVQVDGGVSEENVRTLTAAGASRLIVGSRIWESEDPVAEIEKLRAIAG